MVVTGYILNWAASLAQFPDTLVNIPFNIMNLQMTTPMQNMINNLQLGHIYKWGGLTKQNIQDRKSSAW